MCNYSCYDSLIFFRCYGCWKGIITPFFGGNTLCSLFFSKVNDNFRLYIIWPRPVRLWSSLRIRRDSSMMASSFISQMWTTAIRHSSSVVSMLKKTDGCYLLLNPLLLLCKYKSINTDFTTEEDKRQMSFEFLSTKKQLTPLFICHSNTEIC